MFFQINCFEPVLQCLFTVLFGSALLFLNILPLCASVCLFVCSTHCLRDNLSVCHCSCVLLCACVYVYPCCHLSYHFIPLWSESLRDVSITDFLFLSSYIVGLFNPLPRDR